LADEESVSDFMSNDEYLKKKNSKKPEFLNMSSAKDF
jgi:hypothetical protein